MHAVTHCVETFLVLSNASVKMDTNLKMVDVWISTSAKGTLLFAQLEKFAKIDLEGFSAKKKKLTLSGIK